MTSHNDEVSLFVSYGGGSAPVEIWRGPLRLYFAVNDVVNPDEMKVIFDALDRPVPEGAFYFLRRHENGRWRLGSDGAFVWDAN
jgi:hypothetical protein